MFSKIAVLTLALFSLQIAAAQPGAQCHTKIITPRHFLELDQYLGTWYVQKHAVGQKEDVHIPQYKCLGVDYSVNDFKPKNNLWANETYLNLNDDGSVTVQLDSNDVVVQDLNVPAYFTVYSNRTGGGQLVTDTVVFASDHTSYTIQYGCAIINGSRYEVASAWTRAREIDSILDSFLDSLLEGLGFPREHFIEIDQTNCSPLDP